MPYVELHCHSAFSFLDGASHPVEIAAVAAEQGHEALALTDHDGLHGAMEHAQAASSFGIRPITGAELTLADGSHLTLLCESQTGYRNLCLLVTEAHAGTREWSASGTPRRVSEPSVSSTALRPLTCLLTSIPNQADPTRRCLLWMRLRPSSPICC